MFKKYSLSFSECVFFLFFSNQRVTSHEITNRLLLTSLKFTLQPDLQYLITQLPYLLPNKIILLRI